MLTFSARWRGIFPCRVLPALLGLLLACAMAASPADSAQAGPSVQDLKERITRIQEAEGLAKTTRKELLALYEEALTHAAEIAQFRKEIQEAPDLLETTKNELAEAAPEPVPEAPADASLLQLEQKLAEAEAKLDQAKKRAAGLEEQAKRRPERRMKIPNQLAEAKAELEEINQQLAAAPAAEESAQEVQGDLQLLLAKKAVLQKRIEKYELELKKYDATRELSAARRDLAARRLAHAEELVKAWQELVNQERRREAQRQALEAQRARRQAAQADPAIRGLAEENARLAERRTGPEGLVARIEKVSGKLQEVTDRLSVLDEEFGSVKKKVEAVGLTKAIGQLLLRKRTELPDVHEYRRDRKLLQEETARIQLELLELDDRRSELADIDRQVESIVDGLDPTMGQDQREDIEAEARKLLQARRQYLDASIADAETYLNKLVDLDLKEKMLIRAIDGYAGFIDEHALWVQSNPALGLGALARTWEALRWLASPGGWGAVAGSLWVDLKSNPHLFAIAALVLAGLFLSRRRLHRRLQSTSAPVHDPYADKFYYTLEESFLSLVLAAPGPLILLFLGWRLGAPADATEFVRSVAGGLRATAIVYAILKTLRVICMAAGLADEHFRMRPEGLSLLRKQLFRLTGAVLPAVFLITTMEWQSNDAWKESLGRLAFMAGLIALALFLLLVLRPSGELMRGVLARNRSGWLNRFRHLWYPLAVALPAAAAILAALGYYYAAQQLAERLQATILLVLCALLANAMTVRWLFVVRRRMAVKKALRRRAEAGAEKEKEGEKELPGEDAVPTAEPEPEESLYTLSAQSRRFVQAFLALALVVGFWWIWADIFPALGILRRVRLWPTGVNGQAVWITLADAALALVIVMMTVIASRNVPGLLEIAIFQRLPLDRGVRFAITSLCRYLIIIVGVVLAFGAIGVNWSKVQWLAAAMTVGLGFGLQEIVANFVSGLIILFERPMRVGDTVTVGDVTGTVTRIRIRATTITDWDRKELVVPNKEFITGRLINWTLSDTIIRMVFPVGIAYGSDTALAEELLVRVARQNELVLEEPKPMVIFKGFGDSALDFELRVFIPNMESYLAVWHQINMAIDGEFRQAHIEIAFPQRDIHVRSDNAPFDVLLKKEQEGEKP